MVDYQSDGNGWKRGIAVWGLWLALLVLAFVVVYVIWMRAFFEIYYVLVPLGDASRLAYELTMVGLMFPMVAWLVLGEPYLAAGARQGRLLRRSGYIAIPLLIAGAIGAIIPLL
ncbi:MAG: hypothetical protein HXY39_13180 [Chloroflexi bacterium]|nr:hypothetical protein [Chloroflexota bacterium]